jgi:hypothetical protein
MPSSAPVLSTGAVVDSDAESKAWKLAISSLGKEIMSLRESVDSPLCVNVVFHVDSKFSPNEFEGVRPGRFSKKDSHLLVQAAVPLGPVEDRRGVLLDLLAAAIDEAEAFARNRRLAEDLSEIRTLVQELSHE